jgi:muramoyltetrapeptide carboxypeptidase
MAIAPPFVKPGDTVLIIATARKILPEEVAPVTDILKGWGLKVETGPHLFSEHHQFGGTDEQRAADLQWAVDHPSAAAVLIARGGYGTVRIIDKIDFRRFEHRPKWICGFSDITVLHSQLYKLGYASLHCTMINNFMKHREATLSIKQLLTGQKPVYQFESHQLNRPGFADADLIGGNLSVLYSLAGSNSDISFRSKILFIEDIDEYLYHIDRMMIQLKRAGKLERLAGLVVGGMTDMKDNAVPFGSEAQQIVADAVKEYNYPVCFNFPAGHQDLNMAFYHGKRARLEVNNAGSVLQY